jgi:RNA polymerase sigma factor (sigma-70 family)
MTTTEPTDSEMLDAYAVDGSETAFGQLVRRHLALVYSAALRQLGGDCAAAEDVAQLVFAALARDADRLRKRGSLAGWLHTTTRYQAINVRRSDERRLLRETTALAMNPTDDTAAWEEMSPILDTALHELPETDREAVLLRFFEKLSLGEVGSRLGVGEDAARKRVDRALDKLRGLLAKRGVTSATAAALAALLIDRASASPPVQLAAEVTGAALKAAATAVSGGLLAWFLGWPAKVVLMAGIAAIVASVAIQHRGSDSTRLASVPTPSADIAAATRLPGSSVSGGDQKGAAASAEEDTAGQLKLLLYLVDAATDKPVTGGKIEFRGWEGGKFNDKIYRSDSNGYARVYYPIAITDLEVTTRIDGLADTRLKWTPKNGEIIPPDYTLRLAKGAAIGGVVVDGHGSSIPAATVTLRLEPDPNNLTRPESHEFGHIQARTGTNGRWSVSRVVLASVGKLLIQAAEKGYLPTQQTVVKFGPTRSDSAMEGRLLTGTHRMELMAGRTIRGIVKDSEGRPVAGALVTINGFYVGSIIVETESAADGGFSLIGCPRGEFSVGAYAEGIGTVLQAIKEGQTEAALVLIPGEALRIRVVTFDDQPVDNAQVTLGRETFRNWVKHRNFTEQPTEPFSQRILKLIDGLEPTQPEPGLFVWNKVPAFILPLLVSVPGYMEQRWIGFSPGTEEHLIKMHPSLRVRGEVRDALTGQLIPEFEMSFGRAIVREGLATIPVFPAEEAYTTAHLGGRFERTLDDLFGAYGEKDGYTIQFSARGYASIISRRIEADEGDVVLPVSLVRSGQRVLTVLLPDGMPAGNVEVAAIDLSARKVVIGRDGFDPGQNPVPFRRTDAQGRVTVLKSNSVIGYAAASPEGFVELQAEGLPDQATVSLQPWGRIEGVLVEDGRSLAGRTVVLRSPKLSMLSESGLQLSEMLHAVQTDDEGRFVLPQAPPGVWNLLERVGGGSGVPERLQIPAGETLRVVIGDSVALVSANVVVPGGLVEGLSISGRLDAVDAIPPKGTPVVMWMRDPKHQSVFAGAWQVQGRFSDGRLLIRNVPPGNYRLRVHAQRDGGDGAVPAGLKLPKELPAEVREQTLKAFRQKSVFQIDRQVTVPSPAPKGGIDLGEVRLEPVTP